MTHRFFDGRVAKPHDVLVQVRPTELEITDSAGQSIAIWPIAHLRVADQNAVSGSFMLRLDPDHGQRLELALGEELRQLLAGQPHIARWRQAERLHLFKGFAFWGGIAAALALALYFAWTPATIALATRMPQSWENRIGAQLEESWFPEERRCDGAAGLQALQALGDRIWPGEKGAVQLFVLRDGDPNAFAIPGRRIVVFSGLLKRAKGPEMLAGVLAHEMGHVELRHPIRGLIHQLGLGAVFTLIFGDSSLAGMGQLALVLSYSRDMEREADARGIALLKQAGIRADGMSAFFAEIKNMDLGDLPDFLSTHPDLDERIAATRQPASGAPAMSDADWRSLKDVCAAK